VALAFGVVGYALRYFKVPFLPMVLGVVLGFMVESNYRRALVLSNGDLTTFVRNPISAGLLATALMVLAASLLRQAKGRGDAR
jgi:putative tricarboxylic transport membrane protein